MTGSLSIFLLGPTASGKTELAAALAERLPCDVISVDSTQVYRGLDIGSAKPGPALLAQTPHRLIDICDPGEAYSAARFRRDALREMAQIAAAGRIPLLVGGTMLYFRALQYGLSRLPAADPLVRARILEEASREGWPGMHARLADVDPEAAQRIHPHDPQRIQRALEVYRLSGRPLSALQKGQRRQRLPYRVVKIARAPADREVLRERIRVRFLSMLKRGFAAEVRGLLARGDLDPQLPSLRAVGYRQMVQWLRGECDEQQAIERAIVATGQLAKRQLTWLRADPEIHWLDEEAGDVLAQALKIIGSATK